MCTGEVVTLPFQVTPKRYPLRNGDAIRLNFSMGKYRINIASTTHFSWEPSSGWRLRFAHIRDVGDVVEGEVQPGEGPRLLYESLHEAGQATDVAQLVVVEPQGRAEEALVWQLCRRAAESQCAGSRRRGDRVQIWNTRTPFLLGDCPRSCHSSLLCLRETAERHPYPYLRGSSVA